MRRWLTTLLLAFAVLASGSITHANDGSGPPGLARYETSAREFRRALAADRRGDADTAKRSYQAALACDPVFVEAMVNLARVELAGGNPAAARGWVDRALVAEPAYPAAHALAGVLSLRAGDLARAIDELRSARELTPRDARVLTNLGSALIRRGQLAEAREVLGEAVRLDASSAEATLNLALAEDRAGEAERAAFHYRRFIALAAQDTASLPQVRERLDAIADAAAAQARPGVSSGSLSRAPSRRH